MNDESTTETSRRIVTSFVEYLTTGNFPALLELFHDNATWHVLGDPDGFPAARVYRKDEIQGWFQAMGAAITTPHGMSIDSIMADGSRAAIELHPTGVSASGKIYDNRELFLFEIENGRIRSLRAYCDTRHLQAILAG